MIRVVVARFYRVDNAIVPFAHCLFILVVFCREPSASELFLGTS